MNDPEDQDPQDLSRAFTFRGEELRPYSFLYRAAIYRIGEGHRIPKFEEIPYTIFALLKKTPAQMDTLRAPETIAKFRIEVSEWADKEGVTDGKGWDEIDKLFTDITTPVNEAETIIPAPTPGNGRVRGNE